MWKCVRSLLIVIGLVIGIFIYTIAMMKPAVATVSRHSDNPLYVVINGNITKKTFIDLEKEYNRKPFRVIMVTSQGGDYPTGIDIAKFVEQKKIQIYVPKYCHSSCSFMAMTTPKLMMDKTAIIGIHNLSFSVGDGQDENQRITLRTAMQFAETASVYAGQMIALYAMAGVPAEYLAAAVHKHGNDMVELTQPMLKSWGIAKDFETTR